MQRAMAARNEYVAQNAFYIGGFMYLVFGMVPVNLLPRVHSQPSEKLKLQVARWSIPFMAVIALYTAFNTSTVISAIAAAISLGFAGMSAPGILNIWWKKLNKVGGYSGMAAGFTTFGLLKALYPIVPADFAGFWVSLIVSVVVSLITQKVSPPRILTDADGDPLDLNDRFGTLPLVQRS